jgi:hypothetical protein
MRLNLAHLGCVELLQAGQAVLPAPFVQVVQPRNLVGSSCHHQLPAHLVRYVVFLAESNHLPDASNRQPGLHRPRLVVEAAVQHAAVVAALMLSNAGFFLEHRDGRAWKLLSQSKCGGQPDNSPADHRNAHVLSITPALDPSRLARWIDLIHLSLPIKFRCRVPRDRSTSKP